MCDVFWETFISSRNTTEYHTEGWDEKNKNITHRHLADSLPLPVTAFLSRDVSSLHRKGFKESDGVVSCQWLSPCPLASRSYWIERVQERQKCLLSCQKLKSSWWMSWFIPHPLRSSERWRWEGERVTDGSVTRYDKYDNVKEVTDEEEGKLNKWSWDDDELGGRRDYRREQTDSLSEREEERFQGRMAPGIFGSQRVTSASPLDSTKYRIIIQSSSFAVNGPSVGQNVRRMWRNKRYKLKSQESDSWISMHRMSQGMPRGMRRSKVIWKEKE